jgi:MFS family permease
MSQAHDDRVPSAAKAGRIRGGEWPAVALSFAYFFCVLAAYYVIRPLREQLSAAVGSTQLPWFYGATFIATLVLTPIFAWLIARYSRRIVVPLVYLFFIACLFAFVPVFAKPDLLSPRALGTVFFVWVSVFNLFVVSVFWIFMSDIWTSEQAKRLFPIIAVAGTCGALAGPTITAMLVNIIGVAPLLLVSASLLGVAVACIVLLGRWARAHGERRFEAAQEAPIGGSMWDGLRQVFSDPFMRGMAILLLLADGIGTVNYALVADYSGATFTDAVARTAFAAKVDQAANALTVITQLTVTRWLLPRKGPGADPGVGRGEHAGDVAGGVLARSACVDGLRAAGGGAGPDHQPWPGLRHGRAGPPQPLRTRAAQRALQGPERGGHGGMALRRYRDRAEHERPARGRRDHRRLRRHQRDGRLRRRDDRLAPVAARGRSTARRGAARHAVIHGGRMRATLRAWVPAFAGTTNVLRNR